MSSGSGYVITGPMGGQFDSEKIRENIEARNPPSDDDVQETGEDYWPRVPLDFQPPPAHLEAAVREVNYITNVLQHCPAPTESSDLQCFSDLLLSLETRGDLTKLVLAFTEASYGLNKILKATWPTGERFNIKARAGALKKHWETSSVQSVENKRDDVSIPPFVTTLPEDKPANWKLELNDKASEEADKLFQRLRVERELGNSYFQVNTPKPMGWAPHGDKAWTTVDKQKLQSGDLYSSRYWSPMYMSFGLQAIDFLFWKHPDWSEEQKEEYDALKSYGRAWTDKRSSDELRREDIFKV